MKESSKGQIKDLLVREDRGDFGPDGIGEDLQWFLDNWQTVRGLRTGSLKLFQHHCQIHCPELIPSWCKEIVEDVAPTDFKVSDLEFVPFLNEGEPPIGGTAMRQKAVVLKANYGLSDAKRLLEHQDEISTDGKYIVFAGTVLRDSVGRLCVACLGLGWGDGRWYLDFDGLDGDGSAYDRLPRRK